MPASLKQGDECLVLKLGGTREEFQAQLARAKAVAGRRYNGADRSWEFPDTDESLLKVVHTVEPTLSTDLEARVQQARQEQEDDLRTKLPDDAFINVPWAGPRSWGARTEKGVGQRWLGGKQRAGVAFMGEYPHALEADDMGAGKTIQSISAVYEYAWSLSVEETVDDPKVLIITPNSVLSHWKKDILKWLDPTEKVVIIDGDTPVKRKAQLEEDATWYIVNWEKLQTRAKLLLELPKVDWFAVLADEVHRAKNRNSQQTKGLWKLKAPVQIGATGTPVMNNPGELYSILRWLVPEQYTSYWAFFHSYTEYYEGWKGKPVVIGVKNADALRFELSNKMVRRTKREIHADIPEPFPPIIYEPSMGKEQRALYDSAVKDFWLEIAKEFAIDPSDGFEARGEAPPRILEAADKGDLAAVKLMIPNAAARILRLRQIATSPAILGGPDNSSKFDEIERIVESGGPNRPWVWFAWFQDSVRLLVKRFREAGIDARGFTGETPVPERGQLTDEFQAGKFPIICATIGAGGVGIEFYRASDCGFVEEDWVPANNDQAFSRVDRKGQTERPQRHIVRVPATVETGNIAPKLATKRLITATILGD